MVLECELSFSRLLFRLVAVNGIEVNYYSTTNLSVLTEIQSFFLNKHSQGCCKILIDFHGSENDHSHRFSSFSMLLYKDEVLEFLTQMF